MSALELTKNMQLELWRGARLEDLVPVYLGF